MNSLLIEVRHDLGIGDVGLVVPVETSVDICGLTSALYSLDGGDHALLADADRILGDGAHLGAVVDRVDLGLARVIPGYENLAALTRFLNALNGAFGAPLVRAEDGFEVRVGLDHRLGDVRRLLNVAAAILRADDGDVRILGLDLCQETVSAAGRRLGHLVLNDQADLARASGRGADLVSGDSPGLRVVRCHRRYRDEGLNAGVESNHWNLGVRVLLKDRLVCPAVEGREAKGVRLLGKLLLEQGDLHVNLRLVVGAYEIDRDPFLCSLVLSAMPHRHPELVLPTFR